MRKFSICFLFLIASTLGYAETGHDAWLRYAPLEGTMLQQARTEVAAVIVTVGGASPLLQSAEAELLRGVHGMMGRILRVESAIPRESALVVGTLAVLRQSAPQWQISCAATAEGYCLQTLRKGTAKYTVIIGADERGVLYGAFAFLRKVGAGESIASLNEKESPYAPVRWVNEWNNLDGSIERGYGGRSIFFEGGHVRADLQRVSDYGRLLASLGINACAINNVNSNPRILATDFLEEVSRIAEAFRPWGVKVVLSVDFGSPQTLGKLKTFDPLDQEVAAWWKARAEDAYRAIPDLGGFLMKADSEGRVGPSAYGRTHADAANVVAQGLKSHGGLLFYRGFVYNHHMDWNDPKNDRARAADDNFRALDGKFDNNVVIQIKNGPIDFQVREPVSPLVGTLEKTNQVMEFQITQEYMGQARHLVFLPPQWKEVLDFDLQAGHAGTLVKQVAAGKTFSRPIGGFVAVSNVGMDENWLGNHMSQANLYGFGRLAWNPDLSAKQIIGEWTRLTFGSDPKVEQTVETIQLTSWRTYEDYTGPLGLQTLTDIVGNHYGVAVEASERNGWGQWHRADEKGVGMDRTVAAGTGFTGQYRPPVARMWESLTACPDNLLLFFHHVPYTYRLHSGSTVIQYLYDSHYRGAEAVAQWIPEWKELKGRVDDQRFQAVLTQLEYQAGQAEVWRDAVSNWFLRASGIPDAKGRVGHYPGRYEAESMTLNGYAAEAITPWEAASGGKAIACNGGTCTAEMKYEGAPGWYTVRVQYFDQNSGTARYRLSVGKQQVDEWIAADKIPTRKLDSSSSTRHTIKGIALRPGDIIRMEGIPDSGDRAGIDYIEILAGEWE